MAGRGAAPAPVVSRDTIPVGLVDLDPGQPRSHVDEHDLAELAASMDATGLAQPILVRPTGGRFVVVAGERRLRAARSLGWQAIPAVVRDVPADDVPYMQLVENLQRQGLTATEEARAYRRALDAGMSQADLARRIGKDRSYVAQKLRLLDLPATVLHLVARRHLTEGHARQLLRIRSLYGDATEPYKAPTLDQLDEDNVWAYAFMLWARPCDAPKGYAPTMSMMAGPDAGHLTGAVRSQAAAWAGRAEVPTWEVLASAWALIAAACEMPVKLLDQAIDEWFDMLGAALYWTRGSTVAERPQAAAPSPGGWQARRAASRGQLRTDMGDGFMSDLRHARIPTSMTFGEWRSLTGRAARLEDACEVVALLPSTFQPWGWRDGDAGELLLALDPDA
ncbi:MAG: ParB/RepB/Spo0J family partition protein [Acidimicrobiales bacterium]|nr:ParB/RepB/Spo0J family partition protein [Acidimicrobiales bacterium]